MGICSRADQSFGASECTLIGSPFSALPDHDYGAATCQVIFRRRDGADLRNWPICLVACKRATACLGHSMRTCMLMLVLLLPPAIVKLAMRGWFCSVGDKTAAVTRPSRRRFLSVTVQCTSTGG
jgi:hypothetical protein